MTPGLTSLACDSIPGTWPRSQEVAPIVGDADSFISSGMDEDAIAEFFEDGGLVDGFGPETALVTSSDAPKLECVYKLVAVEDETGDRRPSMKLSTGKVTYPGPKSVRRIEGEARFERDVLPARNEDGAGEELLTTVFEDGDLVASLPDLEGIRDRRAEQVASLPHSVRALQDPTEYPVEISDELQETTDSVRSNLAERHLD